MKRLEELFALAGTLSITYVLAELGRVVNP